MDTGFFAAGSQTSILDLHQGADEGTACTRVTRATGAGNGAHVASSVDGNVGHREKHIALLARTADGRVAQACLDTSHTAGEHATEAVGVERAPKDAFNLVLHGDGDFVTAQVGACNGVVAGKPKCIQGLLQTVCEMRGWVGNVHVLPTRSMRHTYRCKKSSQDSAEVKCWRTVATRVAK